MSGQLGMATDVVHLSYSQKGRAHQLRDISFSVPAGEIACLLGPNGAGKTTLLRCLLGLLAPTEGRVAFGGRSLDRLSGRQRARLVAYVPQSTATTFPFTTLDMAVMGRTPYLRTSDSPSPGDRRAAYGVLVELGLGDLAHQSFSSLSGGERSLTMLARALVQEAPVMVLDEPTAALDLGNTARVLEVVQRLSQRGHTILMTTHQPDHALRSAHRAILHSDGRVVAAGVPGEVLTTTSLTDAYRTTVHIAAASVEGRDEKVLTCITDIESVTASGTTRPT